MGLTQGLLSALVARCGQQELRGTAFGVLNLAIGVAALWRGVVAAPVGRGFVPQGTFAAGVGFTLLALAGLVAVSDRLPQNGGRP